nr:hypothetical protein [Treponema sp.]
MSFSTFLLIETVIYLFFALPSCYSDVRKLLIPLKFVLVGFAVLLGAKVFLIHHFSGSPSFFNRALLNLLIAVATSALLYFCVRVFSAGGLGIGDIFFGVYTAVYCGFYRNLVAAAFAALSGILFYLLAAVVKKVRKRILEKKNQVEYVHTGIFVIPFVPFITFGALLSVFLV